MFDVLELLLVGVAACGLLAAIVQLTDALRSLGRASEGSPVQRLVARIGVRAGIARCLSSVTFLATGAVLLNVPEDNLDYPTIVHAMTVLLLTTATLLLSFSIRDMRDKRHIVSILTEDRVGAR